MTPNVDVPVLASFLAGIATFVSPCVLPLIPVYITFITGVSIEELKKETNSQKRAFFNALFFVLGFSTVFVLLGASATFLGGFLAQKKDMVRLIGGIIVILFGFHIAGITPFKFLYAEKRMEMKQFSFGYLSAFFIGIAFAIGWTPCVGPILSSILIIASTQESIYKGVLLLTVYSLGLGIPFLITALFINKALNVFTFIKRYFKTIEIISGAILVLLGVLMISNSFKLIFVYFNKLFY